MKRLQSKWYFSLLLLPIGVNYFTDKYNVDYLFDNCWYTITGSLIILLVILIYEILLLAREVKKLKKTPYENDQKIVLELIRKLDIDNFENNIRDNDSWYGYDYSAIKKIYRFNEYSALLSNKTSDKKLNNLIDDLRKSLTSFTEYCGENLFMEDNNRIMPAKEKDSSYKKSKEICPIINDKAVIAFNNILELRNYLIKNKYKIK